jgi:hypothetical protein
MLHQLRVDKIPEVYILKRYTRNARSNPTFDRRDYEQTTPDGTSLFCHRKLLAEIAMDLANRGTKSDAGYHRAMSGMRALMEEVDVLNEEEEVAKIQQAQNSMLDNNTEQTGGVEHTATAQIKKEIILPPPVSNTKGRKKGGDAAQKKAASKEKNAETNSKPQPELDSDGRLLGIRRCKTCNVINGHNSRTCKKT